MEEIMKEFERNLMKQIKTERRDLDQSEYTKKKLGDTENQLKMVNALYQALKNQTDLRKQQEYDVATALNHFIEREQERMKNK